MMPTPSVYFGAEAKPLFASLPAEQRKPALDVFYLTDRAPSTDPADRSPYGVDRSRSLAYGSATVEFGDKPDWNKLASLSTAADRPEPVNLHLGQVQELGRFPKIPYDLTPADDGLTRSPSVLDAHDKAAAGLQAELARRLAASPRKEIVLFVHGYNTPFESAVLTIGELCHFLAREFVCATFSWPSGGTRGVLAGYNVDRESAEFATHHFKQALRLIAETPGLEGIHLIAHSRGTDLLSTVASELTAESYVMQETWARRHKIKNIVLLAPDIDGDVAVAKIFSVVSDPDLPAGKKPTPRVVFRTSVAAHVTIYSSSEDKALSVSQWLFGSLLRLGRLATDELSPEQIERFKPLTGVFDLIQVAEPTSWFALGHSYFTSQPAVSSDLISLIRYGARPGEEGRPLEHIQGPFWRLTTAR